MMYVTSINFRATSKTWTWTLKNMDHEKHGINMRLKNMLPLENLMKKMCNVICSLNVCVMCTNFDI